jgi:RNA polymerase sigma-70 factor (ECF subfamily)
MFGKKSHARQFEHLVRPHLDHLYRVAYRFSGNACDAEDLVQDLLVKLYPKVTELAAVEQLRPWLARALYHHAIDVSRRANRSALDNRMHLVNDEDESDPLDSLPGYGYDPELATEQTLTQERLQSAFAKLSVEHRAVVAMHDIEGYSLDELTHLLDTPLGTLKSRLHRARTHLRALLTMEPNVAALRVIG